MTSPVDLERRCFLKKYLTLQSAYAKETIGSFDGLATHAMKKCQEFMDQVIGAFEDKGEQNPDITDPQKQDLLEYLFGTLMNDVTDPLRADPFKNKKSAVEGYNYFDGTLVLPYFTNKIFSLARIRQKFTDESFTTNNKNQLQILAPGIKNLAFFVRMIKFVDTNAESIVSDLVKAAKVKLVEGLKERQKAKSNFAAAENIALGCLA